MTAILWAVIMIIGTLALLFMCFALIPHLYARNLSHSRHILRCGDPAAPSIALTFDDGPDPVFTPQVLDILKRFDVHAAFFLVTGQALAHPALVKRMCREGHLIGLHAREHRHMFLYPPWLAAREIRRGQEEIQSITHEPCAWYRPPWGGFTWAVLHTCRKLHMTCAYWSFDAQDWQARDSGEILRLAKLRTHPGGILLLHDRHHLSGDSPQYTVEALPSLISLLQGMGYQIKRLDEMKQA